MNLFDQLAEVDHYGRAKELCSSAELPDYVQACERRAKEDSDRHCQGERFRAGSCAYVAQEDAHAAGVLLLAGFTGELGADAAYLHACLLKGERYYRAYRTLYWGQRGSYLSQVEGWGRQHGLFTTRHGKTHPVARPPSPARQAKIAAARAAKEEQRHLEWQLRNVLVYALEHTEAPLSYNRMSQTVGAPIDTMLGLLANPGQLKGLLKRLEAKAVEGCRGDAALEAAVKKRFAAARRKKA